MSKLNELEAVLFYKNEAVSKKWLAKTLDVTVGMLDELADELKHKYIGRGISLLELEGKLRFGTSPEYAGLIEGLIKDELSRDLGKAGLETLTIILYYGPLSRSRIDFIRGVNSSFILRNLLMRGLVERQVSKDDQRAYVYKPSFDLLSYLGISSVEELPDYSQHKESFAKAESSLKAESDEGVTDDEE